MYSRTIFHFHFRKCLPCLDIAVHYISRKTDTLPLAFPPTTASRAPLAFPLKQQRLATAVKPSPTRSCIDFPSDPNISIILGLFILPTTNMSFVGCH
mmetsp:Transcript_16258/g.36571  ORF Transcript_16258/g.36571 Transcript_16258/m.36571 type:complete len:97 (-) Transcript_16258:1694-1984(-)